MILGMEPEGRSYMERHDAIAKRQEDELHASNFGLSLRTSSIQFLLLCI